MIVGLQFQGTRARRASFSTHYGGARVPLLLLLIAVVTTCLVLFLRDDFTVGTGPGFPSEHLDLQPIEDIDHALATRTRIFEATQELEGTTIEPPTFAVQGDKPGEQQELALVLKGKTEKRVEIKGNFDPANFSRVVIRTSAVSLESMRILLVRDGKEFLETGALVLTRSKHPQRLVFDLPQTRNFRRPFDALRLIIDGRSPECSLFTVDLIERPFSAWLPAPSSPAPVEIGLESRMAIGLSSRRPLEVELILPPSARLSFGFGQPRSLSIKGQGKPRVRVTVTQGDRVLKKELEFEYGVWETPTWHSGNMPLVGFEDQRATIRFELLVGGDKEALCAITSPVIYSPRAAPPTVVLITSDTHRADHLGSANSQYSLETPALDALAARGVLFEQAYSSTNVTNPSHIALMTATHPRDTEIVNNQVRLSQAAQTLAECYREAGYATYASLCAKHLGHTGSGLGQGFDRMLRPEFAFTDAEMAIDHLEDWIDDARGRPLFIWLHVFDAHHPYGPPDDYDRLYYDKQKDPFDPTLPLVQLPGGATPETIFPPDLTDLRDLEFPKAQYKAEITYLDSQLARVFAWPRCTNATIAMTADHGESFGEHNVFFDHAGAYPQNLHVPLILAGPGIPTATRSDFPVEQIDIGRTLLNLSGLEDSQFPGDDLLAVIADPDLPKRPQFTISAHGFDASATFDRLHLVLHLRDGESTELHTYTHCNTELYDLDADPECTSDLWGDSGYSKRGTQLRKRLTDWLERAEPTGWAVAGAISADTQAELQGLGYTSGEEKRESHVWLEVCED